MHDPADPAGVPPGSAGTAGYENAFEAVTRVINWYRERILEETRTVSPDARRLARLKAARQACVVDRRVLESADPERVATIAAAYEARWRELACQE